MSTKTIKRTALYETHVALGARMVDFAGWEMPLQYRRCTEEVKAVRETAGLGDVSHLGRIRIRGEASKDLLQRVTTNNVASLSPGMAHYSLVCNESGGILDDVVVYCLGMEDYLLCVNASNTDKLMAWFQKHNPGRATVEDTTGHEALLAVQGPRSAQCLQSLVDFDLGKLTLYEIRKATLLGKPGWVARTGYTGERGYEVYVAPEKAKDCWNQLMEQGRGAGLIPVGLGARDLLRLEMGFPLYGHELTEDTTPLDAGLMRALALQKPDFIGKAAIVAQEHATPARILIGFVMATKGIPRQDYEIHSNGSVVGRVTSGNFSPTLKRGIGMGYVRPRFAAEGTEIWIDIRGTGHPARVVALPFYKKKR